MHSLHSDERPKAEKVPGVTRDQRRVAKKSCGGASGVMTFIVADDDMVYEKDLGGDTAMLVSAIGSDSLDPTWVASTP